MKEDLLPFPVFAHGKRAAVPRLAYEIMEPCKMCRLIGTLRGLTQAIGVSCARQ